MSEILSYVSMILAWQGLLGEKAKPLKNSGVGTVFSKKKEESKSLKYTLQEKMVTISKVENPP